MSNPVEHQELERVEQGVVPVQDQVPLLDLLAPLHHQLKHLIEMRLAQFHLVWIYIHLLKFSKEELSGCKIIAIWTRHHNGDSKPLQHCLCTFCSMIWGP